MLEPASFIILMVGLVLYWHFKRRFTGRVLLYSLLAYSGAIIAKVIFQDATITQFVHLVGAGNRFALGWYYGLQTTFFEVGGAYFIARFAVSRKKLQASDAEGYGIGLAFWENAILIGVLGLVNLAADYTILAVGGNSKIAETVYNALNTSEPQLFYSPLQSLPFICYAILERVTSLLFHFCWGLLCLLAAYYNRRRLFLFALPLGLLDFFVPYEPVLGIASFELLIFVLGLCALVLTLIVTRDIYPAPTRESVGMK
ncbi:MAG: YhfC family glutamic-type intramembrane protease [Nitrososphaerales archaeon]